MNFVYHRVPSKLKGSTLYPLNELKQLNPSLYDCEVQKYSGREELLGWRIEPLNCVWNDVLFFSPADPRDIRWAMEKAGLIYPPMQFFKIPAERLDPQRTTIRHYRWSQKNPPRYDEYDPSNLQHYMKVGEATVQDYRGQKERGQDPIFVFAHIFHILYKGRLDVAGMPILEV